MLLTMMATTGTMWGQTRTEEVYKTALFGSSYNSTSVSSYTATWTATNNGFTVSLSNFNNNNNSWNYVKCGRKNNASVGTITTSAAISEAITKVDVTIDAITASNVNSIKLYTSSNGSSWTEAGTYTKATGTKSVSLTSPTANLYYKVEFDCASGSANGLVTVSKVEFYHNTGGNPTVTTPEITPNGGSFLDSQEVSISCATTGATIYYTTDGSTPSTTSTQYTTPFTIDETTTVKAYAVLTNYDDSQVATATFTKATALTVAEAIAATPATGTSDYVYISGIVSAFYNTSIIGDGSNYRYYISDDGTTTNQLLVYKGNGLNNDPFANVNDLLVNDHVIIYGKLTTYNNTKEVAAGNYIYSLERPTVTVEAPTFSPTAGTYDEAQTVTMSCTTEGAAIHYTTDGTEPDGNSNVYSTGITVSETTTFKAKAIKGENASPLTTATYHFCSAESPYTVAQALAFHEYPTSTIWVHGIVSTAPTAAPNSDGQLTYYISDNGEATNQLQVYKGKGLNNAAFTDQDDIQVGDIVTITGTVKIYNTTTEFDAGNYLTSFERPIEPSITVANATVNVGAEGEEGTLTVTYENITTVVADIWFCNAAGTEDATYDWITASINNSTNNADYLVEPNDGNERTAYFKVWAYDDEMNEVYSNLVTVAQAEYVAPTPSIAVDPTLVEAPAAVADGTITVTLTAIANNDIDILWFESDGTTTATYDWILAEVDPNKDIAYVIDENTGDARSAYFKVYGIDSEANDVYSELVTINQEAANTPVTPHFTWDLSIASYDEITDPDIVTWSSIYATMTNSSKSGGTSASNYLGGDANNRTSSRFYNGNTLTISPESGYTILGVVFTATSNNYASTLANSTWNNATATADGSTVTVVPTDGTIDMVASITGTCGFTAVTVYYESDDTPSIAITPALVEATAAETPGNMAITISNMTISDVEQLSADFCDANGDDISSKPDWITDFDFQLNAGVFTGTYTIQANTTTEPRTAYFHVYGLDDDGVTEAYSNVVTVNQEASVAPVASITIDPYLVEATADETEGNLAITLENIVITEEGGGSFDLIFCDSNGEPLANQSDKPEWFGFDFPFENNAWSVYYLIGENTTTTARAAYFKVYALGDNGVTEATSDLVTVTQDGAVVYYLVSFDCDGGTFDGNDDFPTISENKLAGEYTLPSATKSGLTFDGWKLDGTDDIYDAGAQYEVTTNVSFTAQWSSAVTGTIVFGNSGTKINAASVTGDDDLNNEWSITTVGTTSFTQQATYSQVGKSSEPAESITFTMTLANDVIITAFEAKFGGFNGTAGNISLTVDNIEVGSGALNATNDVVVESMSMEFGKTLTVTVTDIEKGVKCYYISYTYEVDDTPYIFINPGPYNLNSEGRDAELEVTYSNMPTDPQAVVIFYESNGETPLTENPTWITATINANGNVDGHIDANTGDARSAYFKVKGIDGDNSPVYSELVTINQAAYTLSIVFETTSLDIEAGGEQNRIISFEYEGLGENPTFTVRTYDASGETQTTYDWLTTSITDVHKVSITVAANTGDARSAYFKVYGENGTVNTESNLVTINQAAAAPAGETYTLVETDNDIVPGQHYIIVGIGGTDSKYYAMGSQNTNYRNRVEVTADGTTIAYIEGVYEVVLSGYRDNTTNTWTIYDEVTVVDEHTGGYLYASGTGSSNYLSTQVTNSDRGQWSISINAESHKATIQANTTATERKILKYNHNSSRFSCYSGGQQDIYLYKKNNDKTYNFYSNTTVASLTVDNDGACIVHEDVALEVTGAITNNGGADNILIENLGQLINKNNVVATLQRDIKGYGDDPNVADGWQTIASPVDGISTSVVATAPYDLYMYNEPNAYWYSNTGSVPFNTLSRSIGYLYANANDMTLNFAGEMIRTDQVVPQTLSYTSNQTDDVRGYNLMGNPFTCNLNAGDIAWINGDAEYFTSYSIAIPTSANLVTYNINERPIKTGEGFFVQASDENQEISFVKTSSKDGVANNGYISINANTEVNFDNAYIQIGNGNTLRKMSIATSSVVYVMNDGDDYAAARVEELAGSMPVYFDAAEDGQCTITITANNLVAHSMHLIDNFTGEDIDLLVNPSYTFFANESDDAARFTLMFDFNDYTGVNESYVNGNFAYQSGDELFISGDGTLQVFDVMGRFVMSKEIHGSESVSVSAFETGVYMLRFVGETVMTQKIVIR